MKQHIHYTLLYLVFFAIYFIGFPLSNSFIGSSDAILHTAMFYEIFYDLVEFMGLGQYGNAMFPETGIAPYMEFYYGETFLFWLPRIFGASDLWSNYFMLITIFSLNAFSVFLLTKEYVRNCNAALFAGFVFAASGYMLSNQELLNGLAFFCVPFAWYFLLRAFDTRKPAGLYWSVFFLGLSTFFSAYFFLIGVVLIGILMLIHLREMLSFSPKHLAGAFFLACLISAPMIFKVLFGGIGESYNPISDIPDAVDRFSLSLYSLITSLPNNLIYRSEYRHFGDQALKMDFSANPGFIGFAFFLTGCFVARKWKWFIIAIVVVTLLFSFGNHVTIGGRSIRMPLYYLYQWDALQTFFRIPGRFYSVTIFGIAVLAGAGYAKIESYIPKPRLFAAFVILLFLIENIELTPGIYNHQSVIDVPECYESLKGNDKIDVIAELPSSLFTPNYGYINDLSEFSREYMYLYWQSKHHEHILNGSASYFPYSRMENNTRLIHLTSEDVLMDLIQSNNLEWIVFHKDLVLNENEKKIMDFLYTSSLLNIEFDDDRTVLFEVE